MAGGGGGAVKSRKEQGCLLSLVHSETVSPPLGEAGMSSPGDFHLRASRGQRWNPYAEVGGDQGERRGGRGFTPLGPWEWGQSSVLSLCLPHPVVTDFQTPK